MAKEKVTEFSGVVTECLSSAQFRVRLDKGDRDVVAYVSGKMKQHQIRVLVGDRVIVQMTPYDLNKGRICFREKGVAPVTGKPWGSRGGKG